jgi:hypothetical protein
MYHHSSGFFWIWLIFVIIAIIPFWRICKRVGFTPWLSLLILVPLANLFFFYYLAFSEWPSQRGSAPPA